jgi:hypothetical protein
MTTTEMKTLALRADTAAKTTSPVGKKELLIKDAQVPGFALRIQGSGATYSYSGRIAKTDIRRTIKIGDALPMPLAKARTKATELRAMFTQGRDPVAEDAAQRAEEASRQAPAVTLGTYAASYLDRYQRGSLGQRKKPTAASVIDETKSVNRAVATVGSNLALDAITIDHARKLKIALGRYSGTTQKKTIGALQRILKAAVEDGLLNANPAAAISMPKDSPARVRYLSRAELAPVWQACGSMGAYATLVRFLITTPVRVSIAQNLRMA